MQQPQFDTFIFDLDGTLLDTLPDLVVLTNTALAECGMPPRTTEEIKSFVGNGARALMYQAVAPGSEESVVDAAMERWKALYDTVGNRLTALYPHMVDALDKLHERGAKLAVLSNKFEDGVKSAVGAYLPAVFSVVHGEGPQIPRKPDPTGLLRTIAELGSSAERCVYVGDSPGDILVAQRAGVFNIGVSWGYHDANDLVAANANVIIDDPLSLLAFCAVSAK